MLLEKDFRASGRQCDTIVCLGSGINFITFQVVTFQVGCFLLSASLIISKMRIMMSTSEGYNEDITQVECLH